jgi:hypothetical protein
MYYTYLWLRDDGTAYYVGKGSGDRAYTSDAHGVHKPVAVERIVIYPAQSEAEAFENEVALIWYYGRKDLGTGCLRNLTDGGENPPNWKGKKRSEHHRKATSAAKKGKPPTKAQRLAVTESNKRRTPPWLGKHLSEEHLRKLNEGRRRWMEEKHNAVERSNGQVEVRQTKKRKQRNREACA